MEGEKKQENGARQGGREDLSPSPAWGKREVGWEQPTPAVRKAGERVALGPELGGSGGPSTLVLGALSPVLAQRPQARSLTWGRAGEDGGVRSGGCRPCEVPRLAASAGRRAGLG